MAPRSRLSIAKKDIVAAINEAEKRVFTRADLDKLLMANRAYWRLSKSTTTNKFIEYLVANAQMELHKFNLPHRPTIRYTWGTAPTLEVVQSLRTEGYFSHFTALQIHGLTEQIPKTVYLNFEQRLSGGGGHLTQEGINRAFQGKCRASGNVTTFRDRRICLLNGQNTGQLGVETIETSEGAKVRVTNIERTLIDICVRPIYCGGTFEVARAFAAASGRCSVNRLVSYLRKLKFTYPYHQTIGFYLDRNGQYSQTQVDLLRQFEIEFDFYLAHSMGETEYIPQWRLFVPKGF